MQSISLCAPCSRKVTDGGGQTLFQSRIDDFVDLPLNLTDDVHRFGNTGYALQLPTQSGFEVKEEPPFS